ncbi:hypothetical protein C9374_000235 [Naegleria lovaniensis]|uniref:Uncharacterized protein n=1 Tax=Naegleria lovaniensis TaxID=51637 RepID=A0AA88KPN7_NAELO|nr:uncharacterized protein C9374_000235 [Naegleria lovaniensis]KAG2388796.1 hypothetical protein C9374_000235 [Naegleria lovaniensis]
MSHTIPTPAVFSSSLHRLLDSDVVDEYDDVGWMRLEIIYTLYIERTFEEEIERRNNNPIESESHKCNPYRNSAVLSISDEWLQNINIDDLRRQPDLYNVILPIINSGIMRSCANPVIIAQKLFTEGKDGIHKFVAKELVREFPAMKQLYKKLKEKPPKSTVLYELPLDIGKSHFDMVSWGLMFQLLDQVFSEVISEKSTFLIWHTVVNDERMKNHKLFYKLETFLDLFKVKPFSNGYHSYRHPFSQYAIDSSAQKKRMREDQSFSELATASSSVSLERALVHQTVNGTEIVHSLGFTAGKVFLFLLYFTEPHSDSEIRTVAERYFDELTRYMEDIDMLLFLFYALHHAFGLFRHNPNALEFIVNKLALGIAKNIYEMK